MEVFWRSSRDVQFNAWLARGFRSPFSLNDVNFKSKKTGMQPTQNYMGARMYGYRSFASSPENGTLTANYILIIFIHKWTVNLVTTFFEKLFHANSSFYSLSK